MRPHSEPKKWDSVLYGMKMMHFKVLRVPRRRQRGALRRPEIPVTTTPGVDFRQFEDSRLISTACLVSVL